MSIHDVCAVPVSDEYQLSKDCKGTLNEGDKRTCCWTTKDNVIQCQSCQKDGDQLFCGPVVFPESLRPGLSGTLDEGGVIEGNTTGPNLTENRLPGGGVFKVPETNLPFSQTDNSSNRSTLTELQSDLEEEEGEEKTGEQDAEVEQEGTEES